MFSRLVGIDLDEVELPLGDYPSMASFFARRLRPGARPAEGDEDAVVSPCDGRVASIGPVSAGSLVQAKGRRYRLDALLADRELAGRLDGGEQVTLYLSPADYHRVHAPTAGKLVRYSYVPGVLLPVGPLFAERVDQLFARNERIVLELETKGGPVAMVLVGALGVGNMKLSNPELETRRLRRQRLARTVTLERPVELERGQELGAFHLGSTVVLVFPPGACDLAPLEEGGRLRCGEPIGGLSEKGAKGSVAT